MRVARHFRFSAVLWRGIFFLLSFRKNISPTVAAISSTAPSPGSPVSGTRIDLIIGDDFSKGIQLSAVLARVDRNCVSHYYAPSERLADIPALVDAAVVRSENNVHELRSRIEKRAKERGIVHEIIDVQSHIFPSADLVVPRARLHDLTLLPVPELIGLDELYFESIIFGSGKPTLMLPTAGSSLLGATLLGTVCIAFDYSRPAARALGDAMAILEMAEQVHVLTVRDEKRLMALCLGKN